LIALIINAHPSRQMARRTLSSQRRTLIRKTSLLHKIEPTALRSSFADVSEVGNQSSVIRFLITNPCFPIPDWR